MNREAKKRCTKKVILSDQKALRVLRQELGMTLKQAGEKIELSSKGIGAIENGRVSLARERIELIVKSYGLEYKDFLRTKRVIDRGQGQLKKRITVKTVLRNQDRRSYQKLVTKECQVLNPNPHVTFFFPFFH